MAQGRVRPYLRVPQGEGFGIATSFSFALANPKFLTTIVALSWFSVSCRILFFPPGHFSFIVIRDRYSGRMVWGDFPFRSHAGIEHQRQRMLTTTRHDKKDSSARGRNRTREKSEDKRVRMVKSVQAIKRNPESSSSLCQRCQGYMVREYSMDRFDVNCLWRSGWRDVNDGAVVGRI